MNRTTLERALCAIVRRALRTMSASSIAAILRALADGLDCNITQ